MTVILQQASEGHLDQLYDLESRAFRTDLMSRQAIRRFVRNGNLFVILRGGLILGAAVWLTRKGTTSSRIYSLAVDPDHQGRGVGGMLISEIEYMAIVDECSEIRLEVREDNLKAINFYIKYGYKLFGRKLRYYSDGTTALRFRKWLPTPRI